MLNIGSNETFTLGDGERTTLSGSEESEPKFGCSHNINKDGEFYSGEGEVLATRGEIRLDELAHASIKKRSSSSLASGSGSRNSQCSSGHWGRPASKIYCHQGNPILFNAVSNIVQREVSANRKFPWALMDHSSSISARSRALNPAGLSGLLARGGKERRDLCRLSRLGVSSEGSTKIGAYVLVSERG